MVHRSMLANFANLLISSRSIKSFSTITTYSPLIFTTYIITQSPQKPYILNVPYTSTSHIPITMSNFTTSLIHKIIKFHLKRILNNIFLFYTPYTKKTPNRETLMHTNLLKIRLHEEERVQGVDQEGLSRYKIDVHLPQNSKEMGTSSTRCLNTLLQDILSVRY